MGTERTAAASTTGIVWEEIPAADTTAYAHTYILCIYIFIYTYVLCEGLEKEKVRELYEEGRIDQQNKRAAQPS